MHRDNGIIYFVSHHRTFSSAHLADPEALYQVATHAGDAVRLVFLECNGVECHIVDGCKEGDYWNFEGRPATFPDTAGQHHRLEVLRMITDEYEGYLYVHARKRKRITKLRFQQF